MNDAEYEESRKRELETLCLERFGKPIIVQTILFDDMPASPSAAMTVFSSSDRIIYAVVESSDSLRLGDVKKLLKNAGFEPGSYIAPYGYKNYFRQQARKIYAQVYPARGSWSDDEELYYHMLVPYSPALVRLRGVSGPIRRYNRFGNNWQIVHQPSPRLYAVKG